MPSRRLSCCALWSAALLLVSCSESSAPPKPAGIAVVAGSGQEATVGTSVTQPVVVEVVDASGRPVRNVPVTWAVTEGGGSITATSTNTDRSGRSEVGWTLGTQAGTNRISATVTGVAPASATATGKAGPPSAADRVSGHDQVGTVSQQLSEPVVLRVRDAHGNGVPGLNVTFSATAGEVSPPSTTTNAEGKAQAAWRLGPGVGPQSLNATIAGFPAPVIFSATANPGAVATLTPLTLTSVTATVGQDLTLAVRARDGSGNPVPSTPVNFSVQSGGGSVGLPVVHTGPDGTAQTSWTLGSATGTQTALVQVAGLPAITYTAAAAQTRDLTNDVLVTALAAQAGTFTHYRIPVPAGAMRLTVTTAGGTGDLDLYVRRGVAPTTSSYDCRSWGPDNNESCVIQSPAAGDWHIMLHSYEAYQNASLRATHLIGGSLAVTIAGLPAGAIGSVAVTGPSNYSSTVTTTQTLTNLAPGSYTLVASAVSHDGTVYAPTPVSQQINVIAAETADAGVTYAQSTGGFNLFISGVHITQAIQSEGGTVPLVAGRSGLLRVLVRGSLPSSETPAVRVRIYHGANLVETRIIPAPGSSTPTTVDLGVLQSTWNTTLNGSLIQPNMSVLAEVDFENLVTETDDSDNTFPSNGTPLALDVRTVSTLQARLVPVQQANGLLGDVTDSNASTYTTLAQALYPLSGINVDVRAPYSFSGVLPSQYDQENWSRLLNEIAALRAADGSSRYYYGVVKPAYSTGGTGLGFIGQPAAIGVDWPNWRAETVAHEWGHNFGRLHVACGNPSGVDPNYPYGGGAISLHGWDVRTNVIRNGSTTFDLMSYCLPYWSSDYTYTAVLNFRAGSAIGGTTAAQPSLLIWGRISPEGVVLEPAFEITTRPVLPGKPGRYRVTATDERGAQLASFSFDGDEIDHLPGVRHFSFAVPLSAFGGEPPAVLRLAANGGEAVRRRAPADLAGAPAADVQLSRAAGGRVRVQWNAAKHPALMIRDPRTGEVLSFARGGTVELLTTAPELEVNASDGVRSERRSVPVPR